jgi:hypothetical protein
MKSALKIVAKNHLIYFNERDCRRRHFILHKPLH